MEYPDSTTHLEKVKDLQILFKDDQVRALYLSILRTGLQHGEIWPDEVDVTILAKCDRQCVGTAWRILKNTGIIEHTKEFRRSNAEGAKGRTIFKYLLKNPHLAQIIIDRNAPRVQAELFAPEPAKPEFQKD